MIAEDHEMWPPGDPSSPIHAPVEAPHGDAAEPIVFHPELRVHFMSQKFGWSGIGGFPPERPDTHWIRVEAFCEVTIGSMTLEAIELQFDTHGAVQALDADMAGVYHYFQLPLTLKPGRLRAQFLVWAGGKKWGSEQFDITVPERIRPVEG